MPDKLITGIGGVAVAAGALLTALDMPILGLAMVAVGAVITGCGLKGGGPSIPGQGGSTETLHPHPVKTGDVEAEWGKFLGPKPYSHKHPRTGKDDPTRLVSADGKRSIRYGDHERNSGDTKHHYHEETWTLDQKTNTMNVDNKVRRVPLIPDKKKSQIDQTAEVKAHRDGIAKSFGDAAK